VSGWLNEVDRHANYSKKRNQNVKAEDNLCLSLAELSRNEEGAAAYNQAIAWQGQSLEKTLGLISTWVVCRSMRIVRKMPSRTYFERLKLRRGSRAHELLGKAYTRLEDFPKAQAELEKAIEFSPQPPNLHCMLAPVYRKQRLAEKAKAEYERCAALTSTHSTPETPR
jgi:tetratricopeptide (TPR) repeat protein